MNVKKIQKYKSVVSRTVNQKSELKKMRSFGNATLQKVVDSFIKVKTSDFSIEDEHAFSRCEKYRQDLLNDETLISYEIFGSENKRSVKEICSIASSPKMWCQFLYCLTKNLQSKNVLEIGTNLGVSGCYILESLQHNRNSYFVSMEGLPQLCKISSRQFSSIADDDNFKVIQGLYDETFPVLLKDDVEFDALFIDGNHKKAPTLEYFNKLKPNISSPAVFIFDDINWDREMQEAWDVIKNDSDVNYTIDLYKVGIAIIDKADKHRNMEFKLHLAF